VKVKGTADAPPCARLYAWQRSICPNEWSKTWMEQREQGIFPGIKVDWQPPSDEPAEEAPAADEPAATEEPAAEEEAAPVAPKKVKKAKKSSKKASKKAKKSSKKASKKKAAKKSAEDAH
jgi:type IV secretory pathway VirB10-like protein